MAFLDPIIAYDELKKQHALTILDEVSDLSIADGDIKLTRDGDFFMGPDDAHCGMRRLVIGWSYLTPTLAHLLASRRALQAERPQIEAEMERQHTLANPYLHADNLVTRAHRAEYHVSWEALQAGEQGSIALAGSTIILLQQLLDRFRSDLKATSAEWDGARPDVRGVSIGLLIRAAANAFRHTDEWHEARRSGKFTGQQRTSMEVLDRAVDRDSHMPYAHLSWERALDAIGGSTLDRLSATVLPYAHNVALMVRARSGSP